MGKKFQNIHPGCSVDFETHSIIWKWIAKDSFPSNALVKIILKLTYFTVFNCFPGDMFSRLYNHPVFRIIIICSKLTCQKCYYICHNDTVPWNIFCELFCNPPPQNSDALIHREANTYLTVKASYDYKQIFFGEYKFFI